MPNAAAFQHRQLSSSIMVASFCLFGLVGQADGAPCTELLQEGCMPAPTEREITATARIQACNDTLSPVGIGYLSERPSGEGVKQVDVMLRIWGGILPGSHAVHIHEAANCRPCSAAGGHFDPGPHSNSNPDGAVIRRGPIYPRLRRERREGRPGPSPAWDDMRDRCTGCAHGLGIPER